MDNISFSREEIQEMIDKSQEIINDLKQGGLVTNIRRCNYNLHQGVVSGLKWLLKGVELRNKNE